MSRPIKHSDPLVEAALHIELWIARVRDHGEESSHYLNGESSLFRGDAWAALDRHRKRLRAALAARGVAAAGTSGERN